MQVAWRLCGCPGLSSEERSGGKSHLGPSAHVVGHVVSRSAHPGSTGLEEGRRPARKSLEKSSWRERWSLAWRSFLLIFKSRGKGHSWGQPPAPLCLQLPLFPAEPGLREQPRPRVPVSASPCRSRAPGRAPLCVLSPGFAVLGESGGRCSDRSVAGSG